MSIVFLVVFKIACFEAIKSVVRNISIAEEVRLCYSLELLYSRFLQYVFSIMIIFHHLFLVYFH